MKCLNFLLVIHFALISITGAEFTVSELENLMKKLDEFNKAIKQKESSASEVAATVQPAAVSTAQPPTTTPPQPGVTATVKSETTTSIHPDTGTTPEPERTTTDPAPAPSSCKCVHYLLCDVNTGEINQHGERVIQMRNNLATHNGRTKNPCHYLEVCCDKLKPEKELKVELNKTEAISGHQYCGLRGKKKNALSFRIMGAKNYETQFGEFPWTVAILGKLPTPEGQQRENYMVGEGSLIHPRVVLTAAHNVKNLQTREFWVRVGEWDTQTTNEPLPFQERNVTRTIVHENYDPVTGFNDIALLFLEEDVTFELNTDTVCLPPTNMSFDGARCFATGWGKNSFGNKGEFAVIMKKVELPVLPRDACVRALRTTRLGSEYELDSSFVCAGGEPGVDTCQGDGGAPLVCKLPNSESYVQLGIVSWGIGCGENGIPGVYADVKHFRNWIDGKLAEAGIDGKYYRDYKGTSAGD